MKMMVRMGMVVLLLALGCNGPFFVFPGGALHGPAEPPPGNWSGVGDSGTVQLETDPSDPYSVNVAYTVLDGKLYINAGDTETEWVKKIIADPRVRLGLHGEVYDLRAERVTDASEIKRFGQAWTDQSMFRRDPAELDQVWLYQLVGR
ncbi:MAG: hypothetical protein CMN75_04610 [Spirochaeta sp.]|nr:hypothetical protein [Spirochaeta sp.]RPG03880.1 MAG: hypothetical protein CBC32_015495 [Proteobacteria bacterium TMED72]